MAVTITDIAKRVGVTPTTISRVLNKSRAGLKISAATRAKVHQAVKEMNYRPSHAARALRKGRTFTLGYICGDIDTPFFAEMVSRAMLEAERHGYELLVSITQWRQERDLKCLNDLLARRVDGVIMMGWGLRPGVRVYEEIARDKFPLVIIGPSIEGLPCVVSDFLSGFRQAITHFQARGHERIAYVGHTLKYLPDAKHEPYLRVCSETGLDPKLYYCDLHAQAARQLGRQLAHDSTCPKALIALSDYIAMGIIRGLADEGVRVPEDIAVMGIDGTRAGEFFVPSLTTIAQDLQAMTGKVISMLLGMIETKEIHPETVTIPMELIVRQSA